MNKNELFKAVGGISEELIGEAEGRVCRRRHVRTGAPIAAAVMAVSATVFAAVNGAKRSVHHSWKIDYRSLPAAERLVGDVGFGPELPEEFANGYAFDEGRIMDSENFDENGQSIEKYKGLSVGYALDGDGIELHINAAKTNAAPDGDLVGEYGGCKLYYYSYMNKFVPGSYELTEQDIADRDSGKYVFSFGSSEVEVKEIKGLSWDDGGERFSLTGIDTPLTAEDMASMAHELIDLQK